MLLFSSTGFHIIKNPRKHKHKQFHFAFNGNGNKRLRHAIRCFVLVPAFEGLNSESGWCAVPACPSFLWKLSPDFHDTGPEIRARFPAKPSAGNRCPIWSARGGNRACYQFRVAGLAIQHRLLHSHRLRPQPGHPKSKIQNPKGPFGFWILEFGFGFWILDLGFWILDFGSWILDLGFRILVFGSV